jgi:nucleoside-diphosphate-sugar epimerase
VQGVCINGRAQGLVSVFARQAAMGGPITVMGTGESVKDLVSVTTVLDVIGGCILQPPTKSHNSQIVLVGSGQSATVEELAEVISNLSGVDIVHIDADPNDLSGYVDCESNNVDLQNMIENIWRAVEIETEVA